MNETPVSFDLPSLTTIEITESKTISIRTCRHEKSNFTNRCAFLSSNAQSLLVLDSFRGHLVDPVKNRLNEKNTNMAVISGELTSKLQLLDVSINKSFKSK
ncbi:7378_t:CDS:2, partial [Scutellospora calospora]